MDKKNAYIVAGLAFTYFMVQEFRLFRLETHVNLLHDVCSTLLNESFQNDIDEEFDMIVETHLEDLDD